MKRISASRSLPGVLTEDETRNVAQAIITQHGADPSAIGLTADDITKLQNYVTSYEASFNQYQSTAQTCEAAKIEYNNTKDLVGVEKDAAGDGRYLSCVALQEILAKATAVSDDQLDARLAQLLPVGWEGARVYFNEPMGVKQLTATEVPGGLHVNWVEREKAEMPNGGISGAPEVCYVLVDAVIVNAVSAPRTECFIPLAAGSYTLAVAAENAAGRTNPTHLNIDRINVTVS